MGLCPKRELVLLLRQLLEGVEGLAVVILLLTFHVQSLQTFAIDGILTDLKRQVLNRCHVPMQHLTTLHIEVDGVIGAHRNLVLGDTEGTVIIEEMLHMATIAVEIIQLHGRQRGNGLFVDLLIRTEHGLYHQLVFVGHTRSRIIQLTGVSLQMFDGGLYH